MANHVLSKVLIPQNWTGEQAIAVVELLDDISTAIWDTHDHKIIESIQNELNEREENLEPPPDDIPF